MINTSALHSFTYAYIHESKQKVFFLCISVLSHQTLLSWWLWRWSQIPAFRSYLDADVKVPKKQETHQNLLESSSSHASFAHICHYCDEKSLPFTSVLCDKGVWWVEVKLYAFVTYRWVISFMLWLFYHCRERPWHSLDKGLSMLQSHWLNQNGSLLFIAHFFAQHWIFTPW